MAVGNFFSGRRGGGGGREVRSGMFRLGQVWIGNVRFVLCVCHTKNPLQRRAEQLVVKN
jgi:hypothetical protein